MTIEERAGTARVRYHQRLQERVQQLPFAKEPCFLSVREHEEILAEAMEGALCELVEACMAIAVNSGLPDGKAIAGLIAQEHVSKKDEQLTPHVDAPL